MGAGGSVGQRGPLEEVTRILEAGGFAAPQGDGSAQEEQLIQFLKLVNAAGLSTVPVVKAEIDQMELPPGALAGGTGEFAAEEAAPVAINNAGEKLARFQAFLKEKLANEGDLFSDAHFVANENAMCIHGVEQDQAVPWKRMKHVYDRPAAENATNPLELFPANEPSSGSVVQSSHLGDCYFIAALSVLAERPEYVRRLFRASDQTTYPADGRFVLNLHNCGQWREISLDDLLPTAVVGGTDRPYFCRNEPGHGYWAPLLEKAYAKIYGSYGAINGGDIAEALRDLTGSPVISHRIDHGEGEKLVKSGAMWTEMESRIRHGHLMACGWCGNEKEIKAYLGQRKKKGKIGHPLYSEIIPNHAYSILDCKEEKGKKLVEVRNPHATWGDHSSDEGNQKVERSNDGRVWVPFQMWTKSFNALYICALHHSTLLKDDPACLVSPSLVAVQGRWAKGSAGGCSQFSGWRDNPQYSLRAKSEGKVYITISQPDKRQGREKVVSVDQFEKLSYNQIGVEIVKIQEGNFGPELVSGKYSVLQKTSFWNKRDVSLELQITKELVGTDIVLIPSTFYPNQEGSFTLTAEWDEELRAKAEKGTGKTDPGLTLTRRSFGSSGNVPLESGNSNSAETGHSFEFLYTFDGEWDAKTSGGPPHNNRFHLNPQYQLNVGCDTDVIVFVRRVETNGKKNGKQQKKLGIGIHAYAAVECLDQPSTVEVLCFGKHPIGKPVLMKAPEISKAISVTTNQNPILIVPCVEKGGKSKFQVHVLTSRPVDIQPATKRPSKAQVDLIKIELEEKQEEHAAASASKKAKKKKKGPKKESGGMSFGKARAGMMGMSMDYGNLE
jgi:hypothetical protein